MGVGHPQSRLGRIFRQGTPNAIVRVKDVIYSGKDMGFFEEGSNPAYSFKNEFKRKYDESSRKGNDCFPCLSALRFSGYFCSSSDDCSSSTGDDACCEKTVGPIPKNRIQIQIRQIFIVLKKTAFIPSSILPKKPGKVHTGS